MQRAARQPPRPVEPLAGRSLDEGWWRSGVPSPLIVRETFRVAQRLLARLEVPSLLRKVVQPPQAPGRIFRRVMPVAKPGPKGFWKEVTEQMPLGAMEVALQAVREVTDSLVATQATGPLLIGAQRVTDALLGKPSAALADALRQSRFIAFLERGMTTLAREWLMGRAVREIADTGVGEAVRIAQILLGARERVRETLEPFYATALKQTEDNKRLIAELRIAVRGPRNIPYRGVPVLLFSKVQKTFTDAEGIATFEDVETGEHALEVRLDDHFVIHRAVIVDPPEGLDVAPGTSVDVLIPLIDIVVAEQPHLAAPRQPSSGSSLFAGATGMLHALLIALAAQCALALALLRRKRRLR